MDHIQKLEYDKNENFVKLNGQRVTLLENKAVTGTNITSVTIEPALNNFVAIQNPFSNLPLEYVEILPHSQNSALMENIHINALVCKNEEVITAIISSLTGTPIEIPEDSKICTIKPISKSSSINSISLIKNEAEIEKCCSFQKCDAEEGR